MVRAICEEILADPELESRLLGLGELEPPEGAVIQDIGDANWITLGAAATFVLGEQRAAELGGSPEKP